MSSSNRTYFSEVFDVEHEVIEEYGALDISLVCDNPAFVDPFLIFANAKYKDIHDSIIDYLRFLRERSIKIGNELDNGTFKAYYKFGEVKQARLGYSRVGNSGLGLSKKFAISLNKNLSRIFNDFGKENITETSHLEKLCIIEEKVGIDKISDFTINLIKGFLLKYTETFALKHLNKKFIDEFAIDKISFNFETSIWNQGRYKLPFIYINGKKEHVILVPKDILTKKDNTRISKNDFLKADSSIFNSIDNDELRRRINDYFFSQLDVKFNKKGKEEKSFSKKSKTGAIKKTMMKFPEIVDYYIKTKESDKGKAVKENRVTDSINLFIDATQIKKLISNNTFGPLSVIQDCVDRILFFKNILESNSSSLYTRNEKETLKEKQLQIMFKNATYGALFNYDSEVNNGRGPIDFIASLGSGEKIGIEFKLVSNSKFKQNMENQAEIYQKDSNLKHVIKVIFYFSDKELERANNILSLLGKREDNFDFFLVDCRKKPSGSNQK